MSNNLNQIKITGVNDFGKIYGKANNQEQKIFVEKAVIGDELTAKIIKQNNKFTQAKIVELTKKSDFRIEPECEFFYDCGGCSFLNYRDDYYHLIKSQILTTILLKNKIFTTKEEIENKINFFWLGSRSRRRAVFQVDKNNSLGFFASQSHDLVKINDCLLVDRKISDLILGLQKMILTFDKGLFSSLSVTLFDNVIDVVLKISSSNESLRDLGFTSGKNKEIISHFANSNNVNFSYQIKDQITSIITLKKNQIFLNKFKIDLDSGVFIQASKAGLEIISQKIIAVIKQNNQIKKIADLYSGFGFYSLAIIEELGDLLNIINCYENDRKMVKLINQNASNYDLSDKIKAYKKDLVKQPLTVEEINKFDLVIINPPRAGAKNQIEKIAASKLKNLIMVSCNPITFATDSRILIDAGFKIEELSAIDQFYSSANFELIANFKR